MLHRKYGNYMEYLVLCWMRKLGYTSTKPHFANSSVHKPLKLYSLVLWETHSESAHGHCLWALFPSAQLLVIHNYSNKWLQACGSDVCGHEVIWRTGADPPEGHHWKPRWILFSLPSDEKKVCERCSQHGSALCSATSRQTRGLCEDPVCGLQLCLQHYHPEPPPVQTNSALRAHLYLSVDQQFPDRQAAAASEAEKIHIQHPYDQPWSSSGLCSLPTALLSLSTQMTAPSKDLSVKLLKFADDTTLIGLIQDGDESAYRQEVKELAVWCSLNNLELNTPKTVEMIVDFRRNPSPRLSPHLPSWTALWLQWSHSDSWAQPSPTTWSGTITLIPLWKRPSRGCSSFTSWESSTCHRSCWNSSTLPSLNLSSARQ